MVAMRKLTLSSVLALSLSMISHLSFAQKLIPYPRPLPPDSGSLTFLPGIVSIDSFDFNACFAPDGKSFYFSRNMNGFTKVFVTNYTGGNWGTPQPMPFSLTNYSDADPAFSPDGKLYFISDRPANPSDTTPDYDIWYSSPQANGDWSAPVNVRRVNSDSNEYYVSFTGNGHMYFGSSRPGGFGQEDIYVSKLVKGEYTKPVNLGPAINTSKAEFDPFISAEENLLFFASSNRDGGFGGADLYCSVRDKSNKWRKAANLGKNINTNTRDFCPYISADGKYFFFSSQRDVKWTNFSYLMSQVSKLW